MAWNVTKCDSSACVKVLDDPENEFVLISTTWASMEMVADRQEWRAFIAAVKDGQFD